MKIIKKKINEFTKINLLLVGLLVNLNNINAMENWSDDRKVETFSGHIDLVDDYPFSDKQVVLSGMTTITCRASVNLKNNINFNGGLTVDTNGFHAAFSGCLTGGGDFKKTGLGSLSISGPNSFNGNLIVSQGDLIFGGIPLQCYNLMVNKGAALIGAGTVRQPVARKPVVITDTINPKAIVLAKFNEENGDQTVCVVNNVIPQTLTDIAQQEPVLITRKIGGEVFTWFGSAGRESYEIYHK